MISSIAQLIIITESPIILRITLASHFVVQNVYKCTAMSVIHGIAILKKNVHYNRAFIDANAVKTIMIKKQDAIMSHAHADHITVMNVIKVFQLVKHVISTCKVLMVAISIMLIDFLLFAVD